MFPRTLLALLLLVTAIGCSRTADVPEDPTMAALHELRSGNFDEAILLASQTLAEQPNNAAAYLYRGRAYQSRNAMGDHQLAIDDFGQAIRLAPEASDAYYSRGLVFRSLGQTAEAEADESRARELDSLAQQVYQKLPEVTPQSGIATKSGEGAAAAAPVESPKTASQLLREADKSGFGQLNSSPKQDSATVTTTPEVVPRSPIAEFNNRHLGGTGQLAGESAAPQTDAFGRPLGMVAPESTAPPADTTAADLSATPGAQGTAQGNSGAAISPNLSRSLIPTPRSPFAARSPAANSTAPGYMPQPLVPHSPFASPITQQPQTQPQAPRGATGYVRPTNPFGTQPGGSTLSRPFSTPSQPFNNSNRVVRPFNARDF